MPRMRPTPARIAVAGAVAVILLLTLTPDYSSVDAPRQFCIACSLTSSADFVLNVALFGPLGLALAWAGWRWRNAVLVACLLSTAIELLQRWVIPGRFSSAADIMANTLGGAIGFWLPAWVDAVLRGGRRAAVVAALGVGTLAAATLVATGWLLAPEIPLATADSAWAVKLGGRVERSGKVPQATFGHEIVATQRAMLPPASLLPVLDGLTPLRLEWRPPVAASARFGSLVRVTDPAGQDLLLFGRNAGDFVIRYRMRATTWRFDQPAVRIPDALLAGDSTAIVSVVLWRGQSRYCAQVDRWETCAPLPTAGAGWSLLRAASAARAGRTGIVNVVWIVLLCVPVGFCAAEMFSAATGLLLTAAGLYFAPVLTGAAPSPVLEWIGLAAGLVAGAALRHLAARLVTRPVEPAVVLGLRVSGRGS